MATQMGQGNSISLLSCSSFHWTTVFLAFLTLLSQIWGFNLDTTHTLHKFGDHGTFFGFSLALHQQLTPEPQSWVLVGAPQAAGQGLLRGSRPGALFRCPITPEEYDCERVDIDGEVRLDRESKDNQWLGVTVKSQGIGGKVVTCAHLYELRQRVNQASETRDPIGRCYVLSEDLTERDDLDGGEWKFCEGRPQGHEQFGFCQQGLSVSFTPDNNFILFGAPGTYNWKGEMRVQLLNQTLLDLGFYDDGPYEVADQKQLNAQLIPVPYHSYLGRIRPLCSLLLVHRREREGWGRDTDELRPYPNMDEISAVATDKPPLDQLGKKKTKHKLVLVSLPFPADRFWLILSECDSLSSECDSTYIF